MFQEQVDEVKQKIKLLEPSMKVLKNLDLFVLDNSLRETTVGQLRGHTIDNKWQIYNQVCCFKKIMPRASLSVIAASLSSALAIEKISRSVD